MGARCHSNTDSGGNQGAYQDLQVQLIKVLFFPSFCGILQHFYFYFFFVWEQVLGEEGESNPDVEALLSMLLFCFKG